MPDGESTALFYLLIPDCWKQDHRERPSFKQIVSDVRHLEQSGLPSISHEEFSTIQSTWLGEVQKTFVELKKFHRVRSSSQLIQMKPI